MQDTEIKANEGMNGEKIKRRTSEKDRSIALSGWAIVTLSICQSIIQSKYFLVVMNAMNFRNSL